jgi:uncharacterized protein YecE (DUF72 family)
VDRSVRVGCSGWQYRHWRGVFYPDALPASRWLEFYAREFDTVEVNNTFYRLPEAATFARWRTRVPAGFAMAVKASRYLTHLKRLKDPAEPLQRLFERAARLGPALGPVLYQLPPRWPRDVARLTTFLDALPDHPQAVEFRDPDWYADDVLTSLRAHGVALCVHDMAGSASPRPGQGPFVYLRLHGPERRYDGRYPDARLREWAAWLSARARSGVTCYVYFNNDGGGHAPRDAARLRAMLGA